MRFRQSILALCALLSVSAFGSTGLELAFERETDLKFDDLFPRRSYLGKSARVLGWSHDDRYMAYLWNGYFDMGSDLWLYDSKSGKSVRVTTPDSFIPFDGDIVGAKEQFEKDQKRLAEWEKLSDEEYRKAKQEYDLEQEKNKEPRKSYPGISALEWSNKGHEFLMTYRGDIYRWKVGDKMPKRLTDTSDSESQVEYLPDDRGFVFQRGSAVYRMEFDSPVTVQLSPALKGGIQFSGFSISPQGDRMLVYGFKSTPGSREVDYIVYRDRFAQARKTQRDVADDDFKSESYMYLYDIREATILDKSKKNEPFEIWKWKGGEEYEETAISDEPWSPDGTKFVFGSWARDRRELKINQVNIADQKVDVIYSGTSNGDHGTPGMANPFYLADGAQVVALLDKSGYRHAHLLDGKGGERQLTQGNFNMHPLQTSADGKSILVWGMREHMARTDVYRVSSMGLIERLSTMTGSRSTPVFANKSDAYATMFSSFNQLRELAVNTGKGEQLVTNSHRSEEFWNSTKLKPELFSFKNRHGDEIHGYQMMPKDMKPGEKRPLFIYVYGGPLGTGKSVEDGSWNSTSTMFAQYLTYTLGYITVTIDPRGQSGYSADFGKANWEQVGVAQTEDIIDLIKHYDEKGVIDRSRVGLNGWSFGGFQTQHTMYTQPGWVTLGIAGAGPTEWQNYNNWYSGGVIGNAPKGKPEELDKYSLTHVAKNLQHPLLLLHGVEDTNVLFQDTVKVYRKLLQAGKGPLVELSIDPTGGHGMGGDMSNRDRHAIYLAFILKHWEAPYRGMRP
jgi:dipeptidyl aminopeptidase/acylaminoacyl peptidase